MATKGSSIRLSSTPLEAVIHLKVSLASPTTSSEAHGLDSVRCSSLHNAIVKHQWQASGYELSDLPTTTWWQRPEYASKLDEVERYLPDSLVEFWNLALHPGERPGNAQVGCFFYIAPCLASPEDLWYEVHSDMSEIERVALYLTDTEISDETMDGVM